MLWFIFSSTWLMAIALLVPRQAGWIRRRALEAAVVLILFLPVLSQCFPKVIAHAKPGLMGVTSWLPAWGMALWILGVLIGAVIGLKQYQLALLLKRQARKLAPDEVTCIQQTLRLDEQTIMDRILVNERIATPMALPSNPGSVVLPEGWLQWSPRLQRAILKHEWHHVDQHDALMGCFMRGFAILFWFNPLAWNLTAAWVAACEHEADLAAVCNDDPVSYADDLLAFARKQSSTANQTFHAQGLPAFTGSKLGQRIALLLSNQGSRSRCLWVTHLSLLTLILSLLGCAWLGRPIAYSDSMREEAATRLSAAAFPADAG